MKLNNSLLILIFILSPIFIFSEDDYGTNKLPHYVWDSDSSNVGQTEIWFQDWTDYTRLFIKSIKDSSSIEKHPYAKTDFNKEYLNAKEYQKPNYIQLLGNIKWNDKQNWSDNYSNTFEWYVDRDQNWYYSNKKLSGNARITNGKLYLQVRDYDKIIIDTISRYRKYK
ncbi:MAG: hypothetical protein ACJZ19_00935 [Candidatus Neomarinimicrobiota bacterium]|tara:strand:- start:1080 stop:1583 length:504 start_codon:yes stop_codon:yes gene_type:complete